MWVAVSALLTRGPCRTKQDYVRFLFASARCASAEPAALFAATLVRPSLSTFEAAVAALAEVTFFADATCDNALPAAVLDACPVALLSRTVDALFDALLPVVFVAMTSPLKS